jgi:rRNA maturation protein Nop10
MTLENSALPQSMSEYLRRFKLNERVFGHGVDTGMSVPCPFCAAPNFWTYRILQTREVLAQERTCTDCGRAAQVLFSSADGSTRFEVIQTRGPVQPAWLTPKMRRLDDAEENHAG